MARNFGDTNILPSVKERLRLIQVLKDSAAKGDVLSVIGLLLVTQSPHDRRKDYARDRNLLNHQN